MRRDDRKARRIRVTDTFGYAGDQVVDIDRVERLRHTAYP